MPPPCKCFCFCLPKRYANQAVFIWTWIYGLLLIALSIYEGRSETHNWAIVAYLGANAWYLIQFVYIAALCMRLIGYEKFLEKLFAIDGF